MESSGDIFLRFNEIFLKKIYIGGVIGPQILLNLRFLRVWGAYKTPLNDFKKIYFIKYGKYITTAFQSS